jgi:glutamine synthetase
MMKLFLAVSLLAPSALAFQPVSLGGGLARSSRSSASFTALGAVNALKRETGRAQLDPAVVSKYESLPFPADLILAEYIWVDADGNTRSKTRTLPAKKVRTRNTQL